MARVIDARVYTNELVAGAVNPAAGQRVLTLGVAPALVVEFGRSVGAQGQVVAIEPWLPEFRRLQLLLQQESDTAVTPQFAARLDELDTKPFDLCVIDITSFPSNRALLAVTQAAAARLVSGGTFYAAGPKDLGIISFSKRLTVIFGHAEPLNYRKGQRIVAAHKGATLSTIDQSADFGELTLELAGQAYVLQRDPSVFAHGELDDATAMLIDALEIKPGDRVLDLGCGAGLLGMVAARHATEVILTDADAGAIEIAARNCAANGLTNTHVLAADINDTIAGEQFSVVVCNPPLHQRHEQVSGLAERFMQATAQALPPGGRGYFVMNRFLAYESRLSAIIGESVEVAGDDRYKVLVATRRKA